MNYIGQACEKETVEAFLSLRTEESFQSLFEALYPRLHRHFRVRGLDSRDAEELAQNVMFLVYRRVAQLRDGASFYGWLFQIARNEYLHHVRRNCTSLATVEYEPLSGWLADTLPAPDGIAGTDALAAWLSHLEATEREILLLHFAEDLGYREIAAVLGIPLGTVKWRVFNAKAKLAGVLKEEAGKSDETLDFI
jgi:RNA polymerase sigma-70 factor (ECF subfamily)